MEVYRDGRVHVLTEKCSSCILRAPKDGQIQGLQPGRITGMVKDSQSDDAGNIPCHQTIYTDGVKPAICRGFWDLPNRPAVLNLAVAMDVVKYVDPPTKEN
jgi:hypothetical protein